MHLNTICMYHTIQPLHLGGHVGTTVYRASRNGDIRRGGGCQLGLAEIEAGRLAAHVLGAGRSPDENNSRTLVAAGTSHTKPVFRGC